MYLMVCSGFVLEDGGAVSANWDHKMVQEGDRAVTFASLS